MAVVHAGMIKQLLRATPTMANDVKTCRFSSEAATAASATPIREQQKKKINNK